MRIKHAILMFLALCTFACSSSPVLDSIGEVAEATLLLTGWTQYDELTPTGPLPNCAACNNAWGGAVAKVHVFNHSSTFDPNAQNEQIVGLYAFNTKAFLQMDTTWNPIENYNATCPAGLGNRLGVRVMLMANDVPVGCSAWNYGVAAGDTLLFNATTDTNVECTGSAGNCFWTATITKGATTLATYSTPSRYKFRTFVDHALASYRPQGGTVTCSQLPFDVDAPDPTGISTYGIKGYMWFNSGLSASLVDVVNTGSYMTNGFIHEYTDYLPQAGDAAPSNCQWDVQFGSTSGARFVQSRYIRH